MSTTKRRKVKAEPVNAKAWEYSAVPEWKLPCTAEAYDQMVEQMAEAMAKHTWGLTICNREYWRNDARRALRAIGITRPKKPKKARQVRWDVETQMPKEAAPDA